jgi:hypothetical protein
MGAGLESCVRRVQGASYGRTLPSERDGRWAEGAAYIVVGSRHVMTWVQRACSPIAREPWTQRCFDLHEGVWQVHQAGADIYIYIYDHIEIVYSDEHEMHGVNANLTTHVFCKYLILIIII